MASKQTRKQLDKSLPKLPQTVKDEALPNAEGLTAFMIALNQEYHECAEILINGGDLKNRVLLEAVKSGNVQCVRLALDAGADVNVRGGSTFAMHDTALIMAVRRGYDTCVETLVSAGADVNKRGTLGYTALMVAVGNGNYKYAKLFIAFGADVNQVQTIQQITALEIAANNARLHDDDKRINCVKLCLRFKAKVNYPYPIRVLQNIFSYPDFNRKVVMLLYAAGERIRVSYDGVPDYIRALETENLELCLSKICRNFIRNHLIELDPHENLFHRVPKLGLPSALSEYLLFNVSLNTEDGE